MEATARAARAQDEVLPQGRVRLCRLCHERPVSPARMRAWDYRCNRCRNRTPASKAATYRHNRTEKRKARKQQLGRRRIFVGRQYHSYAATQEQAERINAHVKDRLNAFKRQQDREKA